MSRRGRKDLDVVREIREQNLAGRQHQHVPEERSIGWGIRSAGNRIQALPTPFKELSWGTTESGIYEHEYLAVGLKRRRTIGNVLSLVEL